VNIQVGNTVFTRVVYDDDADVLYLTVGEEPRTADSSVVTPEGHAIRYDANGEVIGITFVNAKWLLERDGELALYRVDADELAFALA
jgi:uncharacterized protein YuzE